MEVDEARESSSEEKKLCVPNFCPARLLPHLASSGSRAGSDRRQNIPGNLEALPSSLHSPLILQPSYHLHLSALRIDHTEL